MQENMYKKYQILLQQERLNLHHMDCFSLKLCCNLAICGACKMDILALHLFLCSLQHAQIKNTHSFLVCVGQCEEAYEVHKFENKVVYKWQSAKINCTELQLLQEHQLLDSIIAHELDKTILFLLQHTGAPYTRVCIRSVQVCCQI